LPDEPLMVADPPPAGCPVCRGAVEPRRDLPAAFIRESLRSYYREPVPDDVRIDDYRMWKCGDCTLEFAWPMNPGDASFYGWITRLPGYYPADRWEWAEVRLLLAAQQRPQRIVEVGCGAGDFLLSLRDIPGLQAVGLDTTEQSIAACRARGLEVHAETIEAFAHRLVDDGSRPDAVVAFHCLEHVEDPRGFIGSMARSLAPGGRILVSTPYSPMSFEGRWFDPLNHPPHHMTRWNRRSYEELARQLGLTARFIMPSATSVTYRVAESFNLALNGPQGMQDRRTILARAAGTPGELVREVIRQLRHPRMNGRTASNVILVEFADRR
jgi:SAM-dependent methyltransferase